MAPSNRSESPKILWLFVGRGRQAGPFEFLFAPFFSPLSLSNSNFLMFWSRSLFLRLVTNSLTAIIQWKGTIPYEQGRRLQLRFCTGGAGEQKIASGRARRHLDQLIRRCHQHVPVHITFFPHYSKPLREMCRAWEQRVDVTESKPTFGLARSPASDRKAGFIYLPSRRSRLSVSLVNFYFPQATFHLSVSVAPLNGFEPEPCPLPPPARPGHLSTWLPRGTVDRKESIPFKVHSKLLPALFSFPTSPYSGRSNAIDALFASSRQPPRQPPLGRRHSGNHQVAPHTRRTQPLRRRFSR